MIFRLREELRTLEYELHEEELSYSKLPQRKSMTIIRVILHTISIILLAILIVLFVIRMGGFDNAFVIVLFPMYIVIWIIWIVHCFLATKKDLFLLSTLRYQQEKNNSLKKQMLLKETIKDKEAAIDRVDEENNYYF